METKKERYYVTIAVTNYVRRYLLNNFSVHDRRYKSLVNVSSDGELQSILRRSLIKPSHRDDKKLSGLVGKKRNCTVNIEISEDDFNRFGYELSHTDECYISSVIERRCKAQLLAFMSVQVMIHESISFGIQQFYKMYRYDELTWPELSIRKILQRDKNFSITDLKSHISEKVTKIFMENLSIQ